jgi:hypothetical protein
VLSPYPEKRRTTFAFCQNEEVISMSITITIPPELESLVLQRATATGQPVEAYALNLLRRDAELPDPWELFAPVREEIKASGISDEELEAQIEAAIQEVRTRPRA